MQPYRPEGQYALPPGPEALHRAVGSGEIFQAMCVKCDEFHNLHVDLGSIRGLIPREEVAIGISESRAKEFSILSRVGKPVSFHVVAFKQDDTVILSRRTAQLEARSYFLSALRPGDVIPAVVQNPIEFGVFCDIGCGFLSLMRIDRCCVSRLQTTAERFSPGQNIYAAVLSVDDASGQINLTGRELLGSWEENAARFRPGQTVTGIVRSIMPYGIFIELAPNLSGLSEPDARVSIGDTVSVHIRSIQENTHKVKLNILQVLPPLNIHPKVDYFITSGHLEHWEYYPGSTTVTYF